MESSIVGGIQQLYRCASTAVKSSCETLKEYPRFARAMDTRLNELASSRSGGPLFLPPELRNLSARLHSNSAALTSAFRSMQERLHQLVSDLVAAKKPSQHKIWVHVSKVIKTIRAILVAWRYALIFFHPPGSLQSVMLLSSPVSCGTVSILFRSVEGGE